MCSFLSSGAGLIIYEDSVQESCTLWSGFTFWKNLDFGIYYYARPNGVFKNNIFVENGVGIFPMVWGPSSVSHDHRDVFVNITDNIFIGKTSTFDKSLDVIHDDINTRKTKYARSVGSEKVCGKIGFQMTTFTTGNNAMPAFPFTEIMAYQTIKGITCVTGECVKCVDSECVKCVDSECVKCVDSECVK